MGVGIRTLYGELNLSNQRRCRDDVGRLAAVHGLIVVGLHGEHELIGGAVLRDPVAKVNVKVVLVPIHL